MALNCILWNAQSLKNKLSELSRFASKVNAKIIAVTETWGGQNVTLSLPLFHCSRIDRKHGGVALFIHKSLQFKIIKHISFDYGEAIFAEIFTNNQPFRFCVAYCSPSLNITQFETFFNLVLNTYGPVLVAGDFNAKHNAWNNASNSRKGTKLKNLCSRLNYNIFPTSEPTHIPHNGQKPSFLDFVVAKSIHFICDVTVHNELSSDHLPISFKLDTNFESIELKHFNFKKAKWREFRHDLDANAISIAEKLAKSNQDTDIDECIEHCSKAIHEACEKFIPRQPPFKFRFPFSQEIEDLTHERNRLRNAYKRNGNDRLKREVNRLNRAIKIKTSDLERKEFEEKLSKLSHKDNSLYHFGRALKRKQSMIPPLKLSDGTFAYSDVQKCLTLAQNFLHAHKTTIDMSSIKDSYVKASINQLKNLTFDPPDRIMLKDIIIVIKNLQIRKASGPDSISNRIIKNLPKSFLIILTSVFNKCISLSYFPIAWKVANIFPLPKSGKDKKLPTNYRPISLLSNVGKMFERIILDRMNQFQLANNIIIPQQFGFQQNHSTVQQILRITEKAMFGFNKDKTTGLVLLDIEKAFDSVWHEGLIHKLFNYNFPIYIVKLIESFLKNRKAFVSLQKVQSDHFEVPAGVPQGSLLSPLLFNVFINDIITPSECELAIYADDTAIFTEVSCKDLTILKSRLENALSEIQSYFTDWKIKINHEKTEFTLFTKAYSVKRDRNDHKPHFNGVDFEWRESVKYLGVHLDNYLNFDTHFKDKIKIARRMIATMFCMLKKFSTVDVKVKATIYRAYIRPIVMYACPIFSNCSAARINKFQIFQNLCLRMVLSAPYGTRNTDLHDMTKIPTVTDYIEKLTKQFYERAQINSNLLVNRLGGYSQNSLGYRVKHKLPKKI